MPKNEFAERLQDSPILWVQTEEDALSSWSGLDGKPGIDVLAVTSGGCTPLTFLSLGAASVLSIDVNPAQTMVLELKQAAIATLDREDTLSILGIKNINGNEQRYERLRQRLSPRAQSYWDTHNNLFLRDRFIDAGGMQGVGSELKQVSPEQYSVLNNAFKCKSLQEQADILRGDEENIAWTIARLRQNRSEKFFGDDDGYDDDQEVADEMCRTFVTRFQHALEAFVFRTSPWASHMLLGYYQGNLVPHYLTLSGYQSAKRRLRKLGASTTELYTLVVDLPDASLDGADLSNVSDLLSEDEFLALCTEFARVLRPGGRLVHRNLVWDEPYDVAKGFTRNKELSQGLLKGDKSFVYQAFTVDTRNP